MNFKKKIGKSLTSKSVGTGPSSCEKRIYRAAVSQMLRNTTLVHPWSAGGSHVERVKPRVTACGQIHNTVFLDFITSPFCTLTVVSNYGSYILK